MASFRSGCDYNELFGDDFKNLCKSNNILGLEYLKSLNRLGSSIIPITIERKNSNLLSSSDIRIVCHSMI